MATCHLRAEVILFSEGGFLAPSDSPAGDSRPSANSFQGLRLGLAPHGEGWIVFIDWVALLLLNMLCGYFLLAWYVAVGLKDPEEKRWAPAFGMVGLVAFVFGGIMATTWPLPGPFGNIFGEMTVLFGTIFLGASVSIARGWDLRPVALYATFAGLAAMVHGVRIIDLHLTQIPLLSGIGFIVSGIGGISALPTLTWFRENKPVRYFGALVLLLAGLIWMATAYPAFWMHDSGFKDWQPLTMRGMPPPAAH